MRGLGARTPLPGTRLTDTFVESARSVWATAAAAGEDGYFTSYVLHWDGTAWRDTSGPITGVHAQAVSADGRGRAWVSGDPEGWEGPPLYWRYDGRSWTRVAGPVVSGSTQGYEVTGLAPVGRTGRFWAVGDYGSIEGNVAGLRGFVQRSRY